MIVVRFSAFALVLAVITAAPNPTSDPVILKKNEGVRYDYQEDGEGNLHLLDQWTKLSDLQNQARFNPDTQNVLHLFSRANPSVSQPMLLGADSLLSASNFNPTLRTAIIIHGWTESASSSVNTVLVPAFLQAENMNVFVYDWSVGASIIQGNNGPNNAVASGQSLARAIDWISAATGASPDRFHLVGFSLGAHLAGVAGRNVQRGRIAYITALDPGANMEDSGHIFSPNAATYTEAIHTNAGIMGHGEPIAHVDFFPNGGDLQPGCGVNFLCNHYRSFHFFGETLTSTTNWAGTHCSTLVQARLGLCVSFFTLRMGGLSPKTGSTGLYHLSTNAAPPFQPVVSSRNVKA